MDKRLIKVGKLPVGKFNDISDVPGVLVGHSSIIKDNLRTGITAILPHSNNLFTNKVLGATYVFNGFGKSLGLIQVDELGQIETPILLTNTLAVGAVSNALVKYMIKDNPNIGRGEATVNSLVLECNDGELNDIQNIVLGDNEVREAIKDAKANFIQGSIGAGAGMICHGLKGGIGSSSRLIQIGEETYTLGVLVNSNFGHSKAQDLIVNGEKLGEKISHDILAGTEDKGSIIVVIATDIGLSQNSLQRVIKRAAIGIGRTGSFVGHGSGDVFVGFSTKNPLTNEGDFHHQIILKDKHINKLFAAVVEATEEAIYNSMLSSDKTSGFRKTVPSLKDWYYR